MVVMVVLSYNMVVNMFTLLVITLAFHYSFVMVVINSRVIDRSLDSSLVIVNTYCYCSLGNFKLEHHSLVKYFVKVIIGISINFRSDQKNG